jgi:DNA-binding PadR family transcriptional regulator
MYLSENGQTRSFGNKIRETSLRMMIDQGADSMVQNDKLWDSIAKNYEWIGYAQISNSFILLMVLNENKARKKALTAGEISEIIAQKSKGRLYKVPSTLRDALEYRLKREGLVEDEKSIANKSSIQESPKVSKYSITPKGQKLLQGWISFLSAFQ